MSSALCSFYPPLLQSAKPLSHVKAPPYKAGPTGPRSMMEFQLHQQAGTRGSQAVGKPCLVDLALARDDGTVRVRRRDSKADMGEE